MYDLSRLEFLLEKLTDIDPALVERIIQRGQYDRLPRLIHAEKQNAAAQMRDPVIPSNLAPWNEAAERISARQPGSRVEVMKELLAKMPMETQMAEPQVAVSEIEKMIKELERTVKGAPKPRGPGWLARAGLTIGGVGLVAGGITAGSKIYNALTYKRDYENMLEHSPEIKNFDTKEVKSRFDTLRRFNPRMSRDPLVASSWIKQTIEMPVVTPSMLRDVVGTSAASGALDVGVVGKVMPKFDPSESLLP